MKRRAVAAVVAVLAVQSLLLLVNAGTDGASHRAPPGVQRLGGADAPPRADPCRRHGRALDAYTQLVMDNFIDAQPPRLVVNNNPAPGVPLVALAQPLDPDALQYALRSHLIEDIRRNDPSIWTIQNGRVIGLTPWRFADPGPFAIAAAERGPILFRPQPPGAAGDVIAFRSEGAGPGFALTAQAGPLAAGDPRIGRVDLGAGGVTADVAGVAPRAPSGPAPAVHIFCGAGQEWAAEVRRVGDQASVRVSPGACRVEVDGAHVTGFAPLPPQAHLAFVDSKGRRFAFQRLAGGEAAVFSAPAASGRRALDPGVLVFARSVDGDLVRASADCAQAGASRESSTPIQVSLDGGMQTRVQGALEAFLARRFAGGEARPLLAAATVMDARTGEVLAMASSPQPRTAVDLDAPDRAQRRAFDTDINLRPLPIGSAAKPLLSTAILAWRPALAGLATPAKSGAVTDVLGLTFQAPIPGDSKAPQVDFDHFIKDSDNYYAASLLLLASADPASADLISLQPGEGYALCGAPGACTAHAQRPKSVFERVGPGGASVITEPESLTSLGWIPALHELFDAQTAARAAADPNSPYAWPGCSGGGGRYGGQSRDTGVWRSLLDQRSDLDPCGFTQSSPEREALGLEQARDFRRDMLTVILGNGEGRWTAVKLAEAYARLVTGRQVRASFTYTPDPEAAFRAQPLLSADPGIVHRADLDTARRRVTHAMTLVPQGTAAATELPGVLEALQARLAGVAAPDGGHLMLGAFAKTGTPALAEANFTPADLAINRLLASRQPALAWDTRHVAVLVDGAPVPIDNARTPAAAAARVRAARRLGQDLALGLSPRLAVEVVRRLVQDNAALDRHEHPFVVSRDGRVLIQVSPALEQITTPDRSSGKVLAVVVAAYPGSPGLAGADGRAQDASAQPACAFSVVVNFEFPIESAGNPAADFAAEIIRDQLTDRLTACRTAS
jgi:hypothetical protein